ncbi:hypothetical protein [Streptomyces coeruleorubidus]|uniref:hypothetical protein n=1 Tax=Streptomyces coeruleorubidus TaxID=116188 RepID=UPI0033ABA46C
MSEPRTVAETTSQDQGPHQDVPEASAVAEYGTDLLRTSVRAVPGGHEWTRAPGPSAPEPFRPVTGPAGRAAVVGGDGAAFLTVGRPVGEGRLYTVEGGESVANRLLSAGPSPRLREPLRGLGLALRRLHDGGPPPVAERLGPPRGLVRLDTWLDGRAPVPPAAYVGAQLRTRLGPRRWSRAVDWSRGITEDTDVTLVHGAPGLGSLVAGSGVGPDALLTGEDLAVAPWYFDLGWVLGELIELRWQLGGDQEDWQLLLEALFDGYGRDLGDEWSRAAALRILLHVHDIAAYVGWHTAGFDHYATFLTFLLDL